MKSVPIPASLLHTTDQNSSTTGVVLYHAQRDPDGQFIDFRLVMLNTPALALWDRPQDELVGRLLSELVADRDARYLIQQFGLVVEFGRTVRIRMDDPSKQEGSFHQYHLLVVKMDDGVLVTYDDITDSEQAELQNQQEKLHQNAIYQQVIDNIQAGVLLARPIRNEQHEIIDFRYVLTNEYNARTTGRSVAEMTGSRIDNLFPDWQGSDLFRRYVEAVETKQSRQFTFFYESYGMKGWFDGSFSCVDDCVLYTYTDVTAFKEAELIQQQNADLLEQVMHMTPAAIVMNKSVRNEAGEIIDLRMMKLNQMAADVLQNPIEKIQYRRISTYMPGSLETPLFEQCKQVIQTGIPRRVEVPWADRWYDFSVARFGDGVVLAAQDITPMHQYQHQLKRANIELKRSNENLQSFAFIASHDLQEPLRKIISFSDILTTQYASQFDTYVADIIYRINASASRMRLLIQDLLAYSQVETHQDSFVPVNITSLIQELQEHELWEMIHQRKAQIHSGELPVVMADLLQMRQLFQNLLSNSIKFCPNDTTPVITVSSRLIERSNVPARLMPSAKLEKPKSANVWFTEVSITDNGIGFDEKYLDRIFQVFQRLHGRSQYAGSGIGLAICHKIVERHGGAITASSQLGKGSTFRVYLPIRKGI